MKVIIQIPCFNEEESLPVTLRSLPRDIPGVDAVEWLVIDDGSTDKTVEVAQKYGVDYIVSHSRNMGLARAFLSGLQACLDHDADIIVNTDADNQYCSEDIPKLIEPILSGRAELVVGARPILEIPRFSPIKKWLQILGSWIVRIVSNTDVLDAPSGFRAIRRDAAMRLNVFSEYTYTLETIIQAGQKGMSITSVPCRINEDLRPSRLLKSVPGYIGRSILTIVRIFMTYKPFMFFVVPGSLSFAFGFLIGLRFLFFFFTGRGTGYVQSLVLAALLLGTGFFLCVMGLLADLISVNRKLLEAIDEKVYNLKETLKRRNGA